MHKFFNYSLISWIIPLSLIILLIFTSLKFHYLVFHSFAEYFAIFVSLGISLVTYYTYNFTKNRYLLFTGLGYFWVAILDIMHTQTYLGMPLYNIEGSDTSLTFWIFARIFEALILLSAPFMRYVEYKKYQVTLLFSIITIAIIIFAMNFPLKMLIPGDGLTPLKVGLEYFVIFILFLALYVNKRHDREFTRVISSAMKCTIILTILAEASFTLYTDEYGLMNVIGHIFKFLSFWILLQAIIRTSLQEPLGLMQKSSSTYNAIPYPAIVVDKQGIVRQVNAAACKEINKSSEYIIGYSNHDIYHPQSIKEENCPICQSISDGEELEDCILRDMKSKTVKQYSISTIEGSKNNKFGMVQVTVDMTIKTELEHKVRKQKEELTYKASYDSLTDLPNRIFMQDRITQAIQQADDNKTEFALLLIDIDQFKEINDTWGHQVGDEVLKRFTALLKNLIPEEGVLARLGGDEFTVILENIESPKDASLLAQKIIDSAKESINITGHNLYISSSIGVSLYPKDSTDMYDLLKYSDSAMYRAKEEGRNNFQFYSPEMTENTMNKVVMQNDLRNAIENEEFVVYYQPQIDVSKEKDTLIGLEALVRWEHPKLGQIPPLRFISIAEDTGMIVEIDRLVMKMAISQMASWHKEGLDTGILSLNLAMKQLQQDDFIPIVKNILKDYDSNNQKYLSFEITESDLMTNPEASIEKLNILQDLGIKIAIDDFGTGYSSLSYLKRLPISKLKIDQSFIRNLPDDKDDIAIVKTIISLAKNLNMKIIAEGVETEEQKKFIFENGCNEIQGYLYSKPMPSSETKKFIALYQ